MTDINEKEFHYMNSKVEKLFKERIALKNELKALNEKLAVYEIRLKKDFKNKKLKSKSLGDLQITYSEGNTRKVWNCKPKDISEVLHNNNKINLDLRSIRMIKEVLVGRKEPIERLIIRDTNLAERIKDLKPSEIIDLSS